MLNSYETILYPFKVNERTEFKVVRDITTNSKIRKDVLDNISDFELYYMKEGDTPESIAGEYYGDPTLFYTIMLVNDRIDWRKDYPLTQTALDYYILEKYLYPNDVHHYEDIKGNVLHFPVKTDAAGDKYLLTNMPDSHFETSDEKIIDFWRKYNSSVEVQNGVLPKISYEVVLADDGRFCPCNSSQTAKTKLNVTRDVVSIMKRKFGIDIALGNRKYVDASTDVIPITNEEFEIKENDKKRVIRLIKKDNINTVVGLLRGVSA